MIRFAAVSVPVTNLRRRPADAAPLNIHDDLQESQVLFNETLVVMDETEDWFSVEAIEQPKYDSAQGWHGYAGWVRRRDVTEVATPADFDLVVQTPFAVLTNRPSPKGVPLLPLSLGTRLSAARELKGHFEVPLVGGKTGWIPKKDTRVTGATSPAACPPGESVTDVARLFVGAPYLWGGRSMPLPWTRGPVMGVDCSGLVSLAFRAIGVKLPRDAHDQLLVTTAVAAENLRPGDLIFLSRDGRPDSINHVMLSLGGERFVEAAETGDVVRIQTFRETMGVDLAGFEEEALMTKGKKVYFGRV
jgi:gamma-D-glutamyl-L-lysine dipeptidyl-peptidase